MKIMLTAVVGQLLAPPESLQFSIPGGWEWVRDGGWWKVDGTTHSRTLDARRGRRITRKLYPGDILRSICRKTCPRNIFQCSCSVQGCLVLCERFCIVLCLVFWMSHVYLSYMLALTDFSINKFSYSKVYIYQAMLYRNLAQAKQCLSNC